MRRMKCISVFLFDLLIGLRVSYQMNTAISNNFVALKRQAYDSRQNGAMGIHWYLRISVEYILGDPGAGSRGETK